MRPRGARSLVGSSLRIPTGKCAIGLALFVLDAARKRMIVSTYGYIVAMQAAAQDAQGAARPAAGRAARRAGVARTIFSPRKAMDILGAPSPLGRRSFNE
jgi:hypothetical protein